MEYKKKSFSHLAVFLVKCIASQYKLKIHKLLQFFTISSMEKRQG